MLYTVLPGLTLCMSLMNGSSTRDPVMNVDADSSRFANKLKYLDAAIILLRAAKRMETEDQSKFTEEDFVKPESEKVDEEDFIKSESDVSEDFSKENFQCPDYPIDCEELLMKCSFNKSGIYRVWPRSRVDTFGNDGFDVYCDMDTDGGGWTVFQRRGDFGTNSDFFYQSWLNYKYGFGHLNFDFWLGNDKIFALSNQIKSILRIELLDFAEEEGYATYDNFYIDDEGEEYRLHIGDFRGDVGDSLRGHNLCKFSARDQDNDKSSTKHCAQLYKGGWWYNDCHTANLNGLYLKGAHDSYADGINWYGWRGFGYSLKKTEMKLRSSMFQRHFQPEDKISELNTKD